jgi:hypothetical protein
MDVSRRYVSVFNKCIKREYTFKAEGRLTSSHMQQFRAEFEQIPKEMDLFSLSLCNGMGKA